MRFGLLLALAAFALVQPAPTLTVFAASDLGPAFREIVPQFERANGGKVTLVLGSTGMLAHQIRNGAPADAFFAANETFVDELSAAALTVAHTRALYARGRIVIATLKVNGGLTDLKDLTAPRVRRIALANPLHAPYGMAAKQALEATGLWKTLEPRLVYGENVQQAVQFVRSGAADAGIVARSVVDSPDLAWRLVDDRLHAPLNQVAIVMARTPQPAAAAAFIAFVNAAGARMVMKRFGFLLPGE
jgi:molybdate transport system substrate-binding protein